MIKKVDSFFEAISKWGVLITVILMLGLSLSSIILRWTGYSFHWIDPLVRHLVLIAAFFGGSLATGMKQNIKIDLMSRYLENKKLPKLKYYLDQSVTFFSLVIVGFMAKASWNFYKDELEYGKKVFFGIHSSSLVAIIPVGFILIAIRLLFRLALDLKDEKDLKEGN